MIYTCGLKTNVYACRVHMSSTHVEYACRVRMSSTHVEYACRVRMSSTHDWTANNDFTGGKNYPPPVPYIDYVLHLEALIPSHLRFSQISFVLDTGTHRFSPKFVLWLVLCQTCWAVCDCLCLEHCCTHNGDHFKEDMATTTTTLFPAYDGDSPYEPITRLLDP